VKRALSLAAIALGLAGCGASNPPTPTNPGPTAAGPLAQAANTHEYPSPPPRPQTATAGAPTAPATVRAFADAYINWSHATVAAQLRRLAAASTGQARSAMTLAAAQTAGDYELQRGGVSNHGTVEAVAPLPGHRDEFLVVTRERTTATNTSAYQGLQPAWHVTLASAVRLPDGRWAVSAWQPQS